MREIANFPEFSSVAFNGNFLASKQKYYKRKAWEELKIVKNSENVHYQIVSLVWIKSESDFIQIEIFALLSSKSSF